MEMAPHKDREKVLKKLNQGLPEKIQLVVRAGLEPGIPGSEGKHPNHWATLPPHSHSVDGLKGTVPVFWADVGVVKPIDS